MAEKIYYSMGEVAEMLDVSQPLLRFWEKKFDTITPRKNKKGNRMFSPEDVRNLKTIYHLVKERGMTLAGADKYLKANRKAIERDMEIAERLHSFRALLVEVRQELGGEGEVVDDTVAEEIAITEKVETIDETASMETAGTVEEATMEVVEKVAEVEMATEVAEAVETVIEKVAETITGPDKPTYVEQTLF